MCGIRQRIFIELKPSFHRIDPDRTLSTGGQRMRPPAMIHPIHDIPGRLRFILPALRRDRRRAAAVRARMRAIEGVTSASANPLTGSLVVHYAGAAATRENIVASLAEFDPGIVPAEPASAVRARAVADMLAEAVVGRIIERALRAAVAAVI